MSKKRSDGFSRLLLIAIVFLSCFYIGYLLGSPDFSDGVTIVKEKEIALNRLFVTAREEKAFLLLDQGVAVVAKGVQKNRTDPPMIA